MASSPREVCDASERVRIFSKAIVGPRSKAPSDCSENKFTFANGFFLERSLFIVGAHFRALPKHTNLVIWNRTSKPAFFV
jgi:hypothetical protein